MQNIPFVTRDKNGVCSAGTESTTAELCILLPTWNVTRFIIIQSCSTQIIMVYKCHKHLCGRTFVTVRCLLPWHGYRPESITRAPVWVYSIICTCKWCTPAQSSSAYKLCSTVLWTPPKTSQNLHESKTKCAASKATTSSDESALCFAWQFLFNFGETRTPVITQALRLQHKSSSSSQG